MQRTIALLVAVLTVCTILAPALGAEKRQTSNFVERQRIGAGLRMSGGRIVIQGVTQDLPAEKAGLQAGDVVVTVDNRPFTSAAKLLDYIGTRRKDSKLAVVVQRDGKVQTFEVETVTVKLRPTLVKLSSLLLDDRKVALAIVVSDVKSSFDMKREVAESWAAGLRDEEQANLENFYLKNCGNHPGFSIVDRTRTQSLLDELKMGESGLVSEKLRLKIGEMTGATHLLDATFSRFKRGKGHEDVHNVRLIDIQSGTVLAVDQMHVFSEKRK